MEKSFHQQSSNKSSLKPSSNLSLLSSPFDSFRFVVPKSPFRFGGSGNNNKTTDDERLALVERFVAEGLDVRKWTDSQKLPHVWRWLSDADINCQSLRHQIEKMRHQHGEELHEIEDYIEQVWKLSTERLLMLEEENRHLRHNHNANNSATTTNNKNNSAISNQQKQIEDHQYHHRHPSIDYEDDDDEDGDSEIELHKNLCYGFGTADSVSLVNNNNNKSGHVNSLHNNDNKLSHQGHHLVMNSSSSTSSLASSVATGSTGIGNHIVHNNNLCDSLKLRSSKSFGQLTNNGNGNGGLNVDDIHYSSKYSNKNSQNNNSQSISINNNNNNNYCEKCEMLFEDFNKLKSKLSDTIAQLDDVNEKNFILEKLNRCIEIENENFAYKLAESEDRSNQLERRILLLEKECRQLKSKSTSLTSSSNGSMNSNGSTNGPNSLTVDRRLIDELNGKVKSLEEKLDYRFQLYEELEDKYRRQKEKHKETMWKLRHYMEEVKLNPSPSTATSIPEPAKTLSDSCLLQQP